MSLSVESPLSEAEEGVVHRIIGCAISVHRELGPGFREFIYHRALCLEMDSAGLAYQSEKKIEVKYKRWDIPGQRVDLIVENLVLIDVKAVPRLKELHRSQVRSYLKTLGLRLGLLLNFNSVTMRAGTRRVVMSPRPVEPAPEQQQ